MRGQSWVNACLISRPGGEFMGSSRVAGWCAFSCSPGRGLLQCDRALLGDAGSDLTSTLLMFSRVPTTNK